MKSIKSTAALLFVTLMATIAPQVTLAQDAKADAKTSAPASIREALTGQIGKRVAVRVESQDIEGTVAAVSGDTVLLTKISGKDFYDSVVAIAKISAVTYKAR